MKLNRLLAISATACAIAWMPTLQTAHVFAQDQQEMGHHGMPHRVMPPFQSSVQLTPEQIKEAHEAAMDTFTHKLKKYAKVSQKQAEAAATKAIPGAKIVRSILQPFGRNLVYMVMMQKDVERFIVIVDAGNGSVLEQRVMSGHPTPTPTQHSPVQTPAKLTAFTTESCVY